MPRFTLLVKFSLLILIITTSGCSSHANKNSNNYFHQQESFNIARISLHKINILGIIDKTQLLSAKEKQQYTELIFNRFADRVDAENLVSTEDFAKQISIINYQRLVHAAKQNNISHISEIMSNVKKPNRYVLISYLTNKTDYGSQAAWQNCSAYGYAVGLTMKIVDSQTNTLVWDGHIDKQNKVNTCENDDDFFNHSQQNNKNNNDEDEAKSLLAVALISWAINAMVENDNNLASNDFKAIFTQTVDELAKHLPSFYH